MLPKFRVWDEIQHKMLQVDCIEFIDGKAYWVEASSADDNPQGGNDGPVRDNSQLKLEQSTGLKDVNGKEIYEGDIIHFAYNGNDFYSAVVFDDGKFCGKNTIIADVELRHVSVGSAYHFGPSMEYYYYDMYISGNVHENPELLEAQHDTRTD
ncbi:YopX family protein [Levilactobacillus brevis]|uniref:YopX family protein n=1 Tax=Levilactobacillus brevis TaxID=1580 RepID=UPI0020132829|nr:YopX family protein [Levilactobacillus brevis]